MISDRLRTNASISLVVVVYEMDALSKSGTPALAESSGVEVAGTVLVT